MNGVLNGSFIISGNGKGFCAGKDHAISEWILWEKWGKCVVTAADICYYLYCQCKWGRW